MSVCPAPSTIDARYLNPDWFLIREQGRRRAELRLAVYRRDRGLCVWCRRPVSPAGMTLEHLWPRHRGGRPVWRNLAVACMPCNGARGGRVRPRDLWPIIRTRLSRITQRAGGRPRIMR